MLELNEGQAIHSIRRPGTFLTGDYWDEMLVLPFAATPRRPPRSIAILGNAAGTTARAYGHYFPRTHVDAVEIDGELTDIGRRFFDLRRTAAAHPRRRRAAVPAPHRRALRRDRRRRLPPAVHPVLPRHARVLRARARPAAPGGVLLINVGHPEGSDRLEQVLSATLNAVFATVLRDPSEPTNTVLLATRGAASGVRLASAAAALPAALRPVALQTARACGSACRGGRVYTDDVAPVEWLIDTSLVEVAADGDALTVLAEIGFMEFLSARRARGRLRRVLRAVVVRLPRRRRGRRLSAGVRPGRGRRAAPAR